MAMLLLALFNGLTCFIIVRKKHYIQCQIAAKGLTYHFSDIRCAGISVNMPRCRPLIKQ